MTQTPEQIAAGLSKAQRRALLLIAPHSWNEGPSLPPIVLNSISVLRQRGLVEREFSDRMAPVLSNPKDAFRANLSARWYFRVTEAGLAVRAIITKDKP